ncbi:MAG: hypothetical protein DMF63_15700 [Acidobacteria bacterium]|nr:MAG: hypothetical protein DMF63_15700 [Acidobacteriota bacterium]
MRSEQLKDKAELCYRIEDLRDEVGLKPGVVWETAHPGLKRRGNSSGAKAEDFRSLQTTRNKPEIKNCKAKYIL